MQRLGARTPRDQGGARLCMAPHHHSGHARGQRPGGVRVKLSDRYFTKGKPIYAAFCARRAEDQQLVHDFRDACRDCGASVSFMVRSLIQEWLEARRSQGVDDV